MCTTSAVIILMKTNYWVVFLIFRCVIKIYEQRAGSKLTGIIFKVYVMGGSEISAYFNESSNPQNVHIRAQCEPGRRRLKMTTGKDQKKTCFSILKFFVLYSSFSLAFIPQL